MVRALECGNGRCFWTSSPQGNMEREELKESTTTGHNSPNTPARCQAWDLCVHRALGFCDPCFSKPIGSTQYNTTQHNTTQHNTTQHNTTQHNTTQHNTTQHNTTQHNTTQHNTTQHNTTQHNITQHNTTQNNTTPYHTVVGGHCHAVLAHGPHGTNGAARHRDGVHQIGGGGVSKCVALARPGKRGPNWGDVQAGSWPILWCGVMCRRRCNQKAMAGISTHGYSV